MTEKTCFRLVSMLALAVALALPAAPARAEDPPPGDECKEYLRANEASQGKSVPIWIGLAECYQRLGSLDKAVETARQARLAASTPQERAETAQTLAYALLRPILKGKPVKVYYVLTVNFTVTNDRR